MEDGRLEKKKKKNKENIKGTDKSKRRIKCLDEKQKTKKFRSDLISTVTLFISIIMP